MKRNIFIIGILSLLFSFACTKERINTPKKDKIDASLKVGNILLRDGSIIDVKHYDTINKQGVGIIFYVNKKYSQANEIKALAVSLENLMPEAWADTLGKINGLNNSLTEFCGVENNGIIISFGDKYNVRTPVFEKCFYYQPQDVPGWFVPSAGEATALAENFHTINDVNNKIGGEPFLPWYWTASETQENSALGVLASIQENKLINSIKINRFAVRPIIVIK